MSSDLIASIFFTLGCFPLFIFSFICFYNIKKHEHLPVLEKRNPFRLKLFCILGILYSIATFLCFIGTAGNKENVYLTRFSLMSYSIITFTWSSQLFSWIYQLYYT